MKNNLVLAVLFVTFASLALFGCTSAASSAERDPDSAAGKSLSYEVDATVAKFKTSYPDISRFFDSAPAFAVFPSVGKGAIGVGGAHGDGQFYEGGNLAGITTLSQVTIGFQLGGQAYAEIIFFENEASIAQFKEGKVAFSGQVSAVAGEAGASSDADYQEGVRVYTMAKGGLMYEASVGGQNFEYAPIR